MTEDVLQFIWQTQSFNNLRLTTVEGDPVRILKQGILNEDSGPDFSSARIIINDVEWVGDVEIHVKSSAWYSHKHHQDTAYNKVILHVVWQNDSSIVRKDGTKIPTLELKKLVSDVWLLKYERLHASLQVIPCEPFFKEVPDIYKLSSFSKVLIERLQRKSNLVLNELTKLNGDWEQVALTLLFEYFGFKKNNEAFRQLAEVTDYKILRKINSVKQMEAYLLGMAGFINSGNSKCIYQKELQSEFLWLKRKFNFTTEPMSATWWKFMRMRPANFPTLRIAQLASLVFQRQHLFQEIIDASPKEATMFFSIKQSVFWQSHYHFNKKTKTILKGIGDQSSRVLSINVAAVLLVAYGQYTNNEQYTEKALSFLESQKPEDNVITRRWHELGIKLKSAAESQGAIELFNNYCKNRNCLQCNIGSQILQHK